MKRGGAMCAIVATTLLGLVGCAGPDVTAFRSILEAQAAAWNRGDIDGFMEHYWKSENLTFSSGGETTRGWTATRDRYKRRYATPKEMGSLTFSDLECPPLHARQNVAVVLGRWHLARENAPVGGNFTLVFSNEPRQGWCIVHDHTSLDSKPASQ